MGVTVALPVPRRDDAGRGGVVDRRQGRVGAKKLRLVAMEMVHGCAGSTAFGVAEEPVGAGERPAATSICRRPACQLARAVPRTTSPIISNTDLRNAEAFTLPEIGGDHFRSSSSVFLTQSHPKQTEGNDVYSPGRRWISSTRRSSDRTRRFRRCSSRSRTSTRRAAAPTATRASTRTRSAGRRRRSRCR